MDRSNCDSLSRAMSEPNPAFSASLGVEKSLLSNSEHSNGTCLKRVGFHMMMDAGPVLTLYRREDA